jgi:hypothetical protein
LSFAEKLMPVNAEAAKPDNVVIITLMVFNRTPDGVETQQAERLGAYPCSPAAGVATAAAVAAVVGAGNTVGKQNVRQPQWSHLFLLVRG